MKTEKTRVYGLGNLFNKIACYLRTFNPLAAGSIPARPTRKQKGFRHLAGSLFLWKRAPKSTKVYVLGLVAALLVVFSAGSARAEYRFADDWSWKDTAYQGAFISITLVDWNQTRWMARRGWRWNNRVWFETNPIMSATPGTSEVNVTIASSIVLHTLISLALPPKTTIMGYNINPRRIWQCVSIAVETGTVANNFRIGAGIEF